ncbi:MAG TPA: HAMP domain-containing protein, partial [Gemmatimonadales bacterium]|nr:HAMP domain-containing protein [Gemmatimonadales bacterium]
MRTIRGKLTAWYTAALLVALAAFAAALYIELRKPSELELDNRLRLEAELAIRWLQDSHRVLGRLVLDDTLMSGASSAAQTELTGPALSPSVSAYFEAYRDYLIIVNRERTILFLSQSARGLSFQSLNKLTGQIPTPLASRPFSTLSLAAPGGAVRLSVEPVTGAGEDIGAILLAAPFTNTTFDPQVLLNAILVVSPIVVAFAVALAYWLAGTALAPVRLIMDEMDAIKDGRSLHRRLAVPLSNDELARLALTLNGMLARLESSFGSLHRFTA